MLKRAGMVFRKLVPFVLLGILSGCGGSSGGGGGTPATMAGYWKIWVDDGTGEIGPIPVYFEQTGSALDGPFMIGTVSGSNFTITVQEPGELAVTLSGTTNGTTAQGTFSVPGAFIGTFRMETLQPTGTMTVSGAISGEPTGINTTTAVGVREYSDPALTMLTEVRLVCLDANLEFQLEFDPVGLAVGTLNVGGGVTVEVDYTSDTVSLDPLGTSGTVTVTQYDASGFAGTFNITLDTTDVITGTFDVSWDIDSYEW